MLSEEARVDARLDTLAERLDSRGPPGIDILDGCPDSAAGSSSARPMAGVDCAVRCSEGGRPPGESMAGLKLRPAARPAIPAFTLAPRALVGGASCAAGFGSAPLLSKRLAISEALLEERWGPGGGLAAEDDSAVCSKAARRAAIALEACRDRPPAGGGSASPDIVLRWNKGGASNLV